MAESSDKSTSTAASPTNANPNVKNKHLAKGYDEFEKYVEKYKHVSKLFILFTGSKDATGCSWCSDCNKVYPTIDKVFSNHLDAHLLVCDVGNREEWKNPNNDFRKKLFIKVIPTLINWHQHSKKLEDVECGNVDLVSMLIEEN